MPVEIRISTAGADEVAGALFSIGRFLDDWRGAWPAVAERVRVQARRQFASEGGTGRAGRWAPLSDRYRAWKQRYYPGRKILELTGRLRDSLSDSGHPDALEIRGATFLFIGSRVPYAGWHQEGTGRLPRRPPLSPTDRDVFEWAQVMHRYLQRQITTVTGRSTGRLSAAFR